MSLDNPTRTEKIITAWKGWPMAFQVGVPLVLILVLIGGVLFGINKCGNYISGRDIKKARENVNAAMNAVNAGKAVVANDRVDEALAIQNVNAAVQDVIATSNASDQAKQEANAAVANYVRAKQANVPVGTTEEDLKRKLEALGE